VGQAFHNGPDRITGLTIERVSESLLRGLDENRRPPPVDIHIKQDSRRRVVEVPDVVMDSLEMPDTFSGLDVEGEDARAEKVVARPEAAEEIDGRGIGGNVDESAFRIGGCVGISNGAAMSHCGCYVNLATLGTSTLGRTEPRPTCR
jgi:hypothetical protein